MTLTLDLTGARLPGAGGLPGVDPRRAVRRLAGAPGRLPAERADGAAGDLMTKELGSKDLGPGPKDLGLMA